VLLDLLSRLFETLSRAETLLAQPDEDDRAKLVARVAGEYTQLVYLVNKARAEQCAIVGTVIQVSHPLGRADHSVLILSKPHSAKISQGSSSTRFGTLQHLSVSACGLTS